MRILAALVITGSFGLMGRPDLAVAQNPGPQTYPRVIGASGRPYGPTQAHYQYEKRYGRSWDGTVTGNQGYPIGIRNNDAGFGLSPYQFREPGWGWGWGMGGVGIGVTAIGTYGGYPVSIGAVPGYAWNYNPVVSSGFYDPFSIPGGYIFEAPSTYVVPPAPWGVSPLVPPAINVLPNPGLGIAAPVVEQELDLPRLYGLPQDNSLNGVNPPIIPQSTPEAKLRSIQEQTRGDEHLLRLEYPAASQRYRKAIQAAQERVEPVYRYGLVLVAQARYAEAVQQFKLASGLDSTWPQHAPNLDRMFGERNTMEKVQIKHRVAEWTQQNVRDPDRIFLLSMMLHLDDDPRAQGLIDTALRIGGPQPHLSALKIPRQPDAAALLPQPQQAGPGNFPVFPGNGAGPQGPKNPNVPQQGPLLVP